MINLFFLYLINPFNLNQTETLSAATAPSFLKTDANKTPLDVQRITLQSKVSPLNKMMVPVPYFEVM